MTTNTTNLKIETERDQVYLFDSYDFKSTLAINLSAPLEAWDNGTANGANGNVGRDLMGAGTGEFQFPTLTELVDRSDISRIEIFGPTDILTTWRNLILLKYDVKEIGTNAQKKLDFELTVDKDLNNGWDHWKISKKNLISKARTLKLSVDDFGGVLNKSKISISDTWYHDEPDNKIKIVEDRSKQKQDLLNLEDLIEKNLKPKYGKILDFLTGPDDDLPDLTGDLGTPPDSTTGVSATGLWTYFYGKPLLRDKIAKKPTNTKHIIFGLKDKEDKKIYKDKWIKFLFYLQELHEIGIATKSQLIIVSSKYSEKSLRKALKEPGFYRGFPLLDPNLTTYFDSANNELKVKKIDPTKPVRYTEEKINNFRNFATGYTGPNADVFTKKKTIKDKNGNDVQVFANRKPEECLGFQPGDVLKDSTNGKYFYVNGGWYFGGESKIYYDILSAQNAEEAMDLAFFGKDYDEPQSDKATRKGNPKRKGDKKYPSVNLQFNEVKDWSRLEHLNYYYKALKDTASCDWRIPGDATGAGAIDAPKYNDPDTKKKIDDGYQLASKWITDYEKWISKSNYFSSLIKTQLEEAKIKLEKWKTTCFYTSNGVWKPVIDNFLIEINNALAHLNDNDNPSSKNPDWRAELDGLKNQASDLGKKIYQNCQPDQDGFTKSVFEELKKLVKLLEEAHGTKTSNTKTELERFISDSENDANKKKALEIAKKVKNQDSDSEDCVATALEKLKTSQEKQLEKARRELKSLLAGLKINGKDAYEEIITDIKDSETDINKVIEIWQKCQEIDNATSDDNGELLNALNNYKNDSNNKKAWEAVNKYKKGTQSQGYANDMLEKLNDWAEQSKKDYQDIRNAKTRAEFQKAKEKFMKNHEYRNNKKDYDQVYFPLWEKAAEIRERGESASKEKKNLVELITVALFDYSDWKTQLKDLEDKLNKLKKFVEDSEKSKIIKTYSTIQQEALKNLVNKMEAKVKEWKAIKAKFESNNPSQENPPWYRTPLGIFGIVMMIVIVAGMTFYFVKQKPRKENTN